MTATKETDKEEEYCKLTHFKAFGMMTRIWSSKELTKKSKIQKYSRRRHNQFSCTDLTTGQCENKMSQEILTAEMIWLRKIAGVSRLQKIRNDCFRQALLVGQTTLLDKVVQ